MSELALAAFASETGAHLIRPPGGRQWLSTCAASTRKPTKRDSRPAAFVSSRAPAAAFPALLRAIHDPPAGALPPRRCGRRDPGTPGRRRRRRQGVLRVRRVGCADARTRARPRWAPRGVGSRARRRRRGAPRRARSRRADRRSARLRHRSRLSGRARAACAAGRRDRAPRVGVRAGCRARTVAVPRAQSAVAGLCAATVVVEARERSGALITADLALEEGREVYAVPGEIGSALSADAHALPRLARRRSRRAPRTCWSRSGSPSQWQLRPARVRRPLPCSRRSVPEPRRRRAVAANRPLGGGGGGRPSSELEVFLQSA